MSFSTLQAIETCPLQWSLSRAMYPSIWNRQGYPSRAYVGTVVGQVVHQALERVATALSVGESAVHNADHRTSVVKALGGYTAILARESQLIADNERENPRLTTAGRNLGNELHQRLPAMRQALQLLLSRVTTPQVEKRRTGSVHGVSQPPKKVLRHGLNAEVDLRDSSGRWKGIADLIRVEESGAEIIDFKTGLPKDSHALQLRLYALLLTDDREVNPSRLPVTKLTIVYADREASIGIPSGAELADLSAQLSDRATRAQAEVTTRPPKAQPSPEACSFCTVKQLCPAYWTPTGQALAGADVARAGLVDAEVRFHEKYAQSGWRGSVVICGALKRGCEVLVRCPRDNKALTTIVSELLQGRILAAQLVQPAEESGEPPVLNLTRTSEIFAIGQLNQRRGDNA